MWQGVRQNIFLGGGSANKKQLKICVEYTFISEFMLRLHRGNFVKMNKNTMFRALQVARYIKSVKYCA